jgi:Domain found in Dishevelled, Egl-10, and Pleckstrin (DEP)
VAWLTAEFSLTSERAVAVGQALQSLGLLYHVAHEQAFRDGFFFYRLAVSTGADELDFSRVIAQLTSLDIKDRSYLGTSYPNCFVGSQAVDWLCGRYAVTRHDAHTFFQRLHAFGLIDHVTDEHAFIDGNFYYQLRGK